MSWIQIALFFLVSFLGILIVNGQEEKTFYDSISGSVTHDHLKILTDSVQSGSKFDVNWIHPERRVSILGQACRAGNEEMVKFLLANPKIDPNLRYAAGQQHPLIEAIVHVKSAAAKFMVADDRVDFTAVNLYGNTALWECMNGGPLDVAELLIASGRDVNERKIGSLGDERYTAAQLAIKNENADLGKLLTDFEDGDKKSQVRETVRAKLNWKKPPPSQKYTPKQYEDFLYGRSSTPVYCAAESAGGIRWNDTLLWETARALCFQPFRLIERNCTHRESEGVWDVPTGSCEAPKPPAPVAVDNCSPEESGAFPFLVTCPRDGQSASAGSMGITFVLGIALLCLVIGTLFWRVLLATKERKQQEINEVPMNWWAQNLQGAENLGAYSQLVVKEGDLLHSPDFFARFTLLAHRLHFDPLRATRIYAVFNPTLLVGFESHRDLIELRHTKNPGMFLRTDHINMPDANQRLLFLNRLAAQSFDPNSPKPLVVPMLHGTTNAAAGHICELGFGDSNRDGGWYGKGAYFTSNLDYASQYAPLIEQEQERVFVLSMVIPGNAFPVTEHPHGQNSLLGQACWDGYQSHFTVVDSANYATAFPTQAPIDPATTADELVTFQAAQALPLFKFYSG